MNFMTLWTNDFLAGTHPLTPEQRGVFISLICHFINKDRVVPDDDRHLARICNMGARRYRTVKQALIDGDFITIRDGHIWIEKSSNQWNKDSSFSEKQRENALKKYRVVRAKSLEKHNSDSAILSPSLKKEEEGADAPRRYAFEGKVIRLSESDFTTWAASYSAIVDLRAALQKRDDWLARLPASDRRRKDWYVPTSNWLANENERHYAGSSQLVAAI